MVGHSVVYNQGNKVKMRTEHRWGVFNQVFFVRVRAGVAE